MTEPELRKKEEGLLPLLRERIGRDGPMGVDAFMEACLLHPRYGYYRTKDPLGEGGDFVTSPEISQMFGEMIGLWCLMTWEGMDLPTAFVLAELGPGRGTLMADALRTARIVPAFGQTARLHLIETNPLLKERQKEALQAYAPVWHDDIETLPEGPLLLLANEFLDALPVRQFVKRGTAWRERCIGWNDEAETLAFVEGEESQPPFSPSMRRKADSASEGAIAETCEAACRMMERIAARLKVHGGGALFIDYGPSRSTVGDSFQAVRNHRFHPVLEEPGTADLTAHVDFETLKEVAQAAGLTVAGPVPQGEWLCAMGMQQRADQLKRTATPAQRAIIEKACHRLTHPDGMGHAFKVLTVLGTPLS